MRRDTTAIILEKKEVARDHFRMRMSCSWCAGIVRPGQFAHVGFTDTDDPLLRRPYSIYRIDAQSLEILFQVVGKGSRMLAERQVGDTLSVLAPLGTGFGLPPTESTALVVGGGVGMASLFLLVERLMEADVATRVLLGARSANFLLCRADLDGLGVRVDVATDDGSEGFHGFVTDLAAHVLDDEKPQNPYAYACGPTAMMCALSKVTSDRSVPTEVALENRMGCAMGVCLGCVVPVAVDGGIVYERVCTEGPVLDASRVVWEYRL